MELQTKKKWWKTMKMYLQMPSQTKSNKSKLKTENWSTSDPKRTSHMNWKARTFGNNGLKWRNIKGNREELNIHRKRKRKIFSGVLCSQSNNKININIHQIECFFILCNCYSYCYCYRVKEFLVFFFQFYSKHSKRLNQSNCCRLCVAFVKLLKT